MNVGLCLHDLAFLADTAGAATVPVPTDDFDTYTAGIDLNTLNAGNDWSTPYAARGADFPTTDTFDGYIAGVDVDGLSGGVSWSNGYASRDWKSPLDTYDSYTDGADLSGLNGGDNWNTAYVSRP